METAIRRLSAAVVGLVVAMCAFGAHAASLSSVRGQVLVNSGKGFEPADENRPLKAGDSVVAEPNSSAQIVYDGCLVVNVEPGSVVLVAESGESAPGAAPCPTEATSAAGSTGSGFSAAGLAVGGLAAAGAVGIVSAVSNRSNRTDRPVSP